MIRPIRLVDTVSLRRQRIQFLDLPDALVREYSVPSFALQAALPFRSPFHVLVSTSRRRIRATCFYVTPRKSDEARLIAIGSMDCSPPLLARSVEQLVEETCLRSAAEGKLRISARSEEGSDIEQLLRRVGFTLVGQEQIWTRRLTPSDREGGHTLASMHRHDVWDAWKLYSRTEPATVQRAEGLTPATWNRYRSGRSRSVGEWIRRTNGNLVIHQELTYGRRAAAALVRYDPDHSGELDAAVQHMVSAAARHGCGVLYCTTREHQGVLAHRLEDAGFQLATVQSRLVLYTSVLSYVSDTVPASTERIPGVLRTGVPELFQHSEISEGVLDVSIICKDIVTDHE